MQSQWKAHYKISINTKMASKLKFRKYPGCQSKFGLNIKEMRLFLLKWETNLKGIDLNEFYVILNK